VTLALDGHHEAKGREDSRHAAWIINGARIAAWSDNWSDVEPSDLFDPSYEPPTKEDLDKERQELSSALPSTLD
jgi:hypothetical protein